MCIQCLNFLGGHFTYINKDGNKLLDSLRFIIRNVLLKGMFSYHWVKCLAFFCQGHFECGANEICLDYLVVFVVIVGLLNNAIKIFKFALASARTFLELRLRA